jgi:hypothetical protein
VTDQERRPHRLALSQESRHCSLRDAFVDDMQLAVGAGSRNVARIVDLVATLKQRDLGPDRRDRSSSVQPNTRGCASTLLPVARCLVSRGVRELKPRSSRGPLVEVEQSTEPRTPHHWSFSMITDRAQRDQRVAQTLMIAFLMIVLPERAKSTAQHPLPDRDQLR